MLEFEATYIGHGRAYSNGEVAPGTSYSVRFKTIGEFIYINIFVTQIPGMSPVVELAYYSLKEFLTEWQLD